MKHIGDFENYIQMEAICTYLKSFGYKAYTDENTLTTCLQVPLYDTFVVLTFPTWEIVREFIKVSAERAKSLL